MARVCSYPILQVKKYLLPGIKFRLLHVYAERYRIAKGIEEPELSFMCDQYRK